MAKTQKHHILVVDDEPDILSLLEDVLSRRDYIVYTSETISGAMDILDKNKQIELVVSDIKMPEGTGVELLKKIRSVDPVKPIVVFLTAFTDISLEDVYDRGASGFIEKPIDIKNFTKAINELLEDQITDWNNICITKEIKIKLNSFDDIKIGTGGAFIQSADLSSNAKVHELFRLDISFNTSEAPIKGIGQAVWIRKDPNKGPLGIGVKFMELDNNTKKAVYDHIKKNGIISFIPKN